MGGGDCPPLNLVEQTVVLEVEGRESVGEKSREQTPPKKYEETKVVEGREEPPRQGISPGGPFLGNFLRERLRDHSTASDTTPTNSDQTDLPSLSSTNLTHPDWSIGVSTLGKL